MFESTTQQGSSMKLLGNPKNIYGSEEIPMEIVFLCELNFPTSHWFHERNMYYIWVNCNISLHAIARKTTLILI